MSFKIVSWDITVGLSIDFPEIEKSFTTQILLILKKGLRSNSQKAGARAAHDGKCASQVATFLVPEQMLGPGESPDKCLRDGLQVSSVLCR